MTVLACFCNTGFSTWADSDGMCRRCNHPVEEFVPRTDAGDLGAETLCNVVLAELEAWEDGDFVAPPQAVAQRILRAMEEAT